MTLACNGYEVNGIILPEEGDKTGGWIRRRVFLISPDQVMVVLEYREALGDPWIIADNRRFKRDEIMAAIECLAQVFQPAPEAP